MARREGVPLAVKHFDGANGDDGVTNREFAKLLGTECQLVMGYPVEAGDAAPPPGMMETAAYDTTGFVLVVPQESAAKSLADLPAGTPVAVTFEAAPNLYFLNHKNITPDVHETDSETLKALVDGQVKAAMVWQPTVLAFIDTVPNAHLGIHPLREPHARWDVVALYTAQSADAAKRFEAEIPSLHTAPSGGFDPAKLRQQSSDGFDPAMVVKVAIGSGKSDDPPPALYTDAQAKAGAQHYAAICAVCHGAQLQGVVGPALKGPNFASAKAGFAVGDIFAIVANNMPASDPGSLAPDVYVKVMAYLLQQNGYPAGKTPLTYNIAAASNVPLVYRGE